ncbi:hypothetical protein EOA33_06245 [Mesorhizobium sp. M4A.F.Ca.ET.050.02.1.1]|nr:hypothetical protein EOA33_06245 [Mesorhizobium sp. M4A.F.Ca.ET.050.02.1.1]
MMVEPRSPSAMSAARAYRAALARLVRGEGRHPDHQGRIVRISPASVAREAGKSRNPLYTTHRDILDEIEAAAQGPGPAKDLAEKVRELEAEIALLRADARRHAEERRGLASQNLALFHRARTAEGQLASLQRRAAMAPAAEPSATRRR